MKCTWMGWTTRPYEEALTRTPFLVRPRAEALFCALHESNRSGNRVGSRLQALGSRSVASDALTRR